MATSDPDKFLFSRFKRYGSVFRLSMLGFDACVLTDSEALRTLLNDEGAVAEVPVPAYKALMGPYSVISRKHIHATWRKGFSTALLGKGLQAFVPRVVAVMQRHVDRWGASGRMELYNDARRLGLDLGVDVLVGYDLAGRIDLDWLKEQATIWLAGIYSLPINLPFTRLGRAMAAMKRITDALMPVLQKEHDEFKAEWEACGGSAATFVSKYQEAGKPMTVGQATMLGFWGAGFQTLYDTAMTALHAIMGTADTTRFALFNTWALLAILPDVQEKLYEEQKKVIAEHGPELSHKAQMAMPYLEATFKESSRLLPATVGTIRRLTRDMRLGDVTVPSGTYVMFIASLLSMIDPVLWDGDTACEVPPHMDWRNNLEAAFRPERWLSNDTKPRHFYTFGGGVHQCIGMQLVTVEIKLLLAMVVRRYRLVPEVPDMLKRCSSTFPFVVPAQGTDGVRLVAREQPLA